MPVWRSGLVVVMAVLAMGNGAEAAGTAQTLTSLDTWILAEPKAVDALPGVAFDLARCSGIASKRAGKGGADLALWGSERIAAASGVKLPVLRVKSEDLALALTLASKPRQFPKLAGVDEAVFEQLGEQGYALVIEAKGIELAARTPAGLRHALTTLAQIASGRTVLPGMVIRDWPSMKYRGVQQDISRGQVPTPESLERLTGVLAEAKMNELELYIEDVYKYKAFPDVSPPEGLAPEESKVLSRTAARSGVEVHPFLQVLGHSYNILQKPQYTKLAVGPSEKTPGLTTFDVRKPEAVKMVTTMIDELCETFPGDLFTVDITEIDVDGLKASGLSVEQITDLVFEYVLKLNEAVKRHKRRLMIAQGPLDSQGHLAGMGPKLDLLPKDIIIGSYYCAGGPYQPAWEKDFPRMHEKGFDFFAQAWIYSHLWLTPWVNASAEFSNLEVSRGVKHGALGSITCDWGDAGHFHFVGEEWLPYLYHGACAWTGAELDRDYFRKAYARTVYGLPDDSVVRAMETASDVNAKRIKVRDKDGKETEITTNFIWEFVHDPFTHPDIVRLVDPAAVGQMVLDAATPAQAVLATEAPKAVRNQDNLEQWSFGLRCYAALGHKLLALGHFRDSAVPRATVANELDAVAQEFEGLQADFKRLWLAEDRDNAGYQELVKRFTYTSVPCREQAKALRAKK